MSWVHPDSPNIFPFFCHFSYIFTIYCNLSMNNVQYYLSCNARVSRDKEPRDRPSHDIFSRTISNRGLCLFFVLTIKAQFRGSTVPSLIWSLSTNGVIRNTTGTPLSPSGLRVKDLPLHVIFLIVLEASNSTATHGPCAAHGPFSKRINTTCSSPWRPQLWPLCLQVSRPPV